MFWELLQLALGNLMRARGRLVMTAGGVLVGTTAVLLLLALTNGLQAAAESSIGSAASLTTVTVFSRSPAGVPAEDSNTPILNDRAVQTFQSLPGVAAVVPLLSFRSRVELIAGDYINYGQIVGINPAHLAPLGVQLDDGQLELGDRQAILGGGVGESFFDPEDEEWEPVTVDVFNDPLEMKVYASQGEEQVFDLDVSGVLSGGGGAYDRAIFMAMDEVREFAQADESPVDPDAGGQRYDQIVVRSTGRTTTKAVSEAIADLGYGISGVADFLDQLNSFFNTMRLLLGGIGGVALLVAAFGVANTMTMAILERTREIGLMKALGARDQDVLVVFLLEAGLVGLCGGLAGLGLSYALQRAINQAIQRGATGERGVSFLPFDPSQIGDRLIIISPDLALAAVVLATLVGLLAGLWPALRAARLPPMLALQQE